MFKKTLAVLALLLLVFTPVLSAHASINAGPPTIVAAADDATYGIVDVQGSGFLWGSTPTLTFAAPDGTVLKSLPVFIRGGSEQNFFLTVKLHPAPCVRQVLISTYDTGPATTVDLGDPAVVAENNLRLALAHLAAITYSNDPAQIQPADEAVTAAYAVYSAAVAEDARCK